jgi:hypothetical protein
MGQMLRVISMFVVGAALLAGSIETASAQSIIRAVYRISLTDPATGNVYYSDRQSLRSWTSEEECERRKESFSGHHTSSLTKENIMNADGQPLEVAMASIHCVVIRE